MHLLLFLKHTSIVVLLRFVLHKSSDTLYTREHISFFSILLLLSYHKFYYTYIFFLLSLFKCWITH